MSGLFFEGSGNMKASWIEFRLGLGLGFQFGRWYSGWAMEEFEV